MMPELQGVQGESPTADMRLPKPRHKSCFAGHDMSLWRWLVRCIQHFLMRYPYAMGTTIACVLAFLGDFAAQWLEASHSYIPFSFHVRRSFSFWVTSGMWNGIAWRTWINSLEQWLPGKDLGRVSLKIMLSQFLLNPFVYMPYFHIVHGMLLGETLSVAFARLQAESLALDVKIWCIFIPSNFILFTYIPSPYRVVWTSSVSLGWGIILSICTSRGDSFLGFATGLEHFGVSAHPSIGTYVSAPERFGTLDISSGVGAMHP